MVFRTEFRPVMSAYVQSRYNDLHLQKIQTAQTSPHNHLRAFQRLAQRQAFSLQYACCVFNPNKFTDALSWLIVALFFTKLLTHKPARL